MKLRDADGDLWEHDGTGWLEPESGCWISTREGLDRVYGPLTEVPQA